MNLLCFWTSSYTKNKSWVARIAVLWLLWLLLTRFRAFFVDRLNTWRTDGRTDGWMDGRTDGGTDGKSTHSTQRRCPKKKSAELIWRFSSTRTNEMMKGCYRQGKGWGCGSMTICTSWTQDFCLAVLHDLYIPLYIHPLAHGCFVYYLTALINAMTLVLHS